MYSQCDQLPVLASTLLNSTVSKANWRRQLYPETLKSREEDAPETAQAEENFNSITTKSEGKLLIIMEIQLHWRLTRDSVWNKGSKNLFMEEYNVTLTDGI